MNTSSGLLLLSCVAVVAACGASANANDPNAAGAQQQDAAPPRACHYVKETSTVCPDFSLPATTTEECVDGVDCATLNSEDSVIAGCDDTTLYLDKVQIDGTCADWGAQSDAGATARADASRWPDAGRAADAGRFFPDGASGADSASVCGPADVSRFVPTLHPPTGAHQGKCTATDIDGFYADCWGPSHDQQRCNAAAATTCGTCLFSPEANAAWGPLVETNNFSFVNVAGCVALLSPGDIACSNVLQSSDECELAACQHCASTDLTAYVTCTLAADANGCSAYASPPACAAEADGGAAAACVAHTDFAGAYRAVAIVFCGP